jgi:hypothetical protein
MVEREQKCRNDQCGQVMFKQVLVDEKNDVWAMSSDPPLDLESDDTDHFYRCPYCKKKNVVIETTPKSGHPQHEISHIKE